MPRFVVLLRGVNVGKGNRVPMVQFRALLEALEFEDVRTLLNSGNAVFSSPARSSPRLARAIRSALQEELGLDIRVVVKSAKEFQTVVDENQLAPLADDPSRLLVAFAEESATLEALSVLSPLLHASERLTIGKHASYLLCTGGILESKAAGALLGKVGKDATTRNWATVLKLHRLLAEKKT